MIASDLAYYIDFPFRRIIHPANGDHAEPHINADEREGMGGGTNGCRQLPHEVQYHELGELKFEARLIAGNVKVLGSPSSDRVECLHDRAKGRIEWQINFTCG